MKRILFTVLIVNALIILSLSSCKKDDPFTGPVTAPGAGGSTPAPIATPFTIDLVASNWVNYANEVYVSTFQGIISTANASGNRTVKVYLTENGEETMINHPISFMGNQLWATSSKTDVSIVYKCSQTLPFKSLNIKVVVE